MTAPLSGRREKFAWGVVGLVVGALVLYVLVSFVGAIVVGLFLYYATRPADRWLHARTGKGRLSAAITLVLVGIPILFIVGYATFVGLRELDQFLTATNLERARASLEPYLGSAAPLDRQGLVELVRGNVSQIGAVVGTAAGWLLRIFVVLAVAYYLLKDDQHAPRGSGRASTMPLRQYTTWRPSTRTSRRSTPETCSSSGSPRASPWRRSPS